LPKRKKNVLSEKNITVIATDIWQPIGEVSIAETVVIILRNAEGGRL
jgi:hypothetical protein